MTKINIINEGRQSYWAGADGVPDETFGGAARLAEPGERLWHITDGRWSLEQSFYAEQPRYRFVDKSEALAWLAANDYDEAVERYSLTPAS